MANVFSLAGMPLSLSGEVEENPGPTDAEMIKYLLETQKVILCKLSETQENQAISEASLLQMNNRYSTIKERLKDFDAFNSRLTKAEVCLDEKDREISALNRKVDELENRSRPNISTIRGINEYGREIQEILKVETVPSS